MKSSQLQINELMTILNQHFQWNKARMACFVGMLIALMGVGTVNLTQLALTFPSRAQIPSRYRRMQRFFSGHRIDYHDVARFIMKLFGFTDTDFYLSLDRTNWKWGSVNINLLVLAVVYRGAAIPVYWLPLNKRGNSNSRERKALLQRFITQFGKGRIKGLLADREFIGDSWMSWLIQEQIPFFIRIRNNSISTNRRGQKARVDRLFGALTPGDAKRMRQSKPLGQCQVYLSALRLADGELLIIASNRVTEDALTIYGLRWEIETLFGCLKGRGFKLEETRVVGYLRIKKLLVLPVIAFCWAQRVGDWKHDCVLPLKVKTHRRKAQSIFRYGLDCLRTELYNAFSRSIKQIRLLISLLLPTLKTSSAKMLPVTS
jgi:Transposase DDE domain